MNRGRAILGFPYKDISDTVLFLDFKAEGHSAVIRCVHEFTMDYRDLFGDSVHGHNLERDAVAFTELLGVVDPRSKDLTLDAGLVGNALCSAGRATLASRSGVLIVASGN